MWSVVYIACVVLAGALPAADGPPGGAIAGVEEQLVEKKLHLAQVYRFRGRPGRALALVRQAQAVRPADARVARLAVALWQEGWDAAIVQHIEKSPDKVALKPLETLVNAEAVGAALVADLAGRDGFQIGRAHV